MAEPGNPLPMVPDSLAHAGDTSPCIAHQCRQCCFDTQMPLTDQDLTRLTNRTGRDLDGFSVSDPETGVRRLVNDGGQCVFLGPTGCTVYEDRPAGCRIYPLVLDPETHKGVLDDECPHTRDFRIRPKDRAALAGLVKTLGLMDHL